VVETGWLDKLVGKVEVDRHEAACDERTDDDDDEEDEHAEVHDSVANDTTSAQLRLLQRVDRRTDLATGSVLAEARIAIGSKR